MEPRWRYTENTEENEQDGNVEEVDEDNKKFWEIKESLESLDNILIEVKGENDELIKRRKIFL